MANKESAPILKKVKRPNRIIRDEAWAHLGNITDLAALTALVRPGPLEINHELIRRLNGLEPLVEVIEDFLPEIKD